ncbi:DNA cytosine methyltransferase [Herbaspirillum chlorophenolicum]|uniref:DNA cytosine methyltransferase n=1 Tax=Herbaspirillum chlorophenolicum TaxID=211589 RepID=UPI00067C072D|nr:DNA cytosine methyltransferase [Herbaspirillum chlorophenolicum]
MAHSVTENSIPIVDLFAGPGGLGEGFSGLSQNAFHIAVSAEMEASAHQTLRLRAYFRILKRKGPEALRPYYLYCNGEAEHPYDMASLADWECAGKEALQLTLGEEKDNLRLERVLKEQKIGPAIPWVLIGGPPCQAYSLVGRSRNMGTATYVPEKDHRHFLYKEYLKIIQRYRPAVFVMENVKGILSASVGGKRIFETILRDLADPDLAMGSKPGKYGYRIHSLSCQTYFDRSMDPDDINPKDFVLRSEDYGIPQARHRVILIGVREDIDIAPSALQKHSEYRTVEEAIGSLPPLRSRLSKESDSPELWADAVNRHLKDMRSATVGNHEMADVRAELGKYAGKIASNMESGALRYPRRKGDRSQDSPLEKWYADKNLKVWLNHDVRSHMSSDLGRYAYASVFAGARKRSPSGHEEFDLLETLHPNHENWTSGKFKDRFRVQLKDMPSTTVTSHIAKDGHYFIHPDPAQCRSLTVREAARLQTFPDNYFFQGNRTQQYHQVGNAVPPMLAQKIAKKVLMLLQNSQ